MGEDYPVYKTEEDREKALEQIRENFKNASILAVFDLIKAGLKTIFCR